MSNTVAKDYDKQQFKAELGLAHLKSNLAVRSLIEVLTRYRE
jgi:hypothetical protein